MHCVKFSTNQSIIENGMHPILSESLLDFPPPEYDESNNVSGQYFPCATASTVSYKIVREQSAGCWIVCALFTNQTVYLARCAHLQPKLSADKKSAVCGRSQFISNSNAFIYVGIYLNDYAFCTKKYLHTKYALKTRHFYLW